MLVCDCHRREGPSDEFGGALVAADFDDDGFDDLAVAAPNDEVAGVSGAGAVHVIFGGAPSTAGRLGTVWIDGLRLTRSAGFIAVEAARWGAKKKL